MRYLLVLIIVALFPFLFGCGKSKIAGAQTTPAVEAEQQEPEEKPIAESPTEKKEVKNKLQPDPEYPIPPDYSASQLLHYINHLASLEPRGDTDDGYIRDQISRAKSRLLASDQIILTKGLTADLLEAGVRAKLDALRMLAIIDPQGLGKNFERFIEALNEGDSEKFSRMGRINQFWLEVDRLVYQQTKDATALMSKLEGILADEKAGEAEFLAAQDGAIVLNDRGYPDECTRALKLIGKRFADHEVLAKEAKELLQKTEFREQVIAAMGGGRNEIRTLFTSIRDLLKNKDQLTLETLDNTLNAAQVLEYNGHFEEAKRVFIAVRKAFSLAEDSKLADQAKISVEFAEKRLGMVGKEIKLEGSHIDGTDFNWKKYKGKVVLVDFWASTSSPWVASLPNLRTAYDRFHKDGFEVIGINVDRDRQRAYAYIQGERLPWPTIVDEVANGLDGNPNALRYGIRAVPFVMLVGRDGKVTDIHIRGPELTSKIEALLAQPSSQNARKEQSLRK